MDNSAAERLIESNLRLIEAIGMHWSNEVCKMSGEVPAYNENHFSNLAHKFLG
ncbi:hypothetical protein LCGC14_2567210 [marine sediment metagenome]|uniref:Uncharacterized protein n=1 Tax=marine sediment metagenome TaxID=412755 RepID=A0A0F9AIA4_9ZZZZ